MLYFYNTPLAAIFSDAQNGKWETVFFYLNSHRLNVNAKDPSGFTLLDYAIGQSNRSQIHSLPIDAIIRSLKSYGAKTRRELECLPLSNNPHLSPPPARKAIIEKENKKFDPHKNHFTQGGAEDKASIASTAISSSSTQAELPQRGVVFQPRKTELKALTNEDIEDTADEDTLLDFAELEASLLKPFLEPAAVSFSTTHSPNVSSPLSLNPSVSPDRTALTYAYPLNVLPELQDTMHSAENPSLHPCRPKIRM